MKKRAVIGLGGNLPSPYGEVTDTLEAGIKLIGMRIGPILQRSPWYRSKPEGVKGQPDFINAAVLVETDEEAWALLASLQAIESTLGRMRGERWSARTADLDLLALESDIAPSVEGWKAIVGDPNPMAFTKEPMLPHPRLHKRLFALMPFYDVMPDWVHPVLGEAPSTLLSRLGGKSRPERL